MSATTLQRRLRDSARAGPYLAPSDARALLDAVRQTGLKLVQVDLSGVRDKAGLLMTLASALHFPQWFGGNWDALEECLVDLPDTPHGYALVVHHCAQLAEQAPDDFATAVDICRDVARSWSKRSKGFWTLFGGISKPIPGLLPLA